MKTIIFFSYIFILITTFSPSVISQPVYSKIAVINTEALKDRQNGIKEVVEAYDKLDSEFKPQNDELDLIAEKAKKLAKEINEIVELHKKSGMWICGSSLSEQADEFAKLQTEYKEKDDKRKLLYDKRKAEIFVEIDKKIQTALMQFAKENNFEVLLDGKELEKISPYVCFGDDMIFVTDEFIEFYNKQAETRP